MRSFIRRSRTGAVRDDEGSGLILVFLVMLISSALSLVLLESAVSMANQTQGNNKRVTSLSAAQAGLDAGLAQIRNAVGVTGSGDVSQIPCTVAPGAVGGTNGAPTSQGTNTGSYSLSVAYFATDPTAQSNAWRSDSANQINCPQHGHPDKVPLFGLVTSTGKSATGKPRTVQSTYIFTTTNQNISGGLIHVSGGGSGGQPDICPDAGSAHPAVGDVVTMQLCDKNDQGQLWAYQGDLSFLLTSTTNDAAPKAPMCMQVAGNPAPNGTLVKMAVCTGLPNYTGSVTLGQQFSYDDNGEFENSKPNGTGRTLAGTCMNETTSNTAGSTLQIGGCGTVYRPEPSVGAGMAGPATTQLVNYQEFGRCLDATGQNPNAAYMIAYPCKQSPNPADLTWNQKYTINATAQTISTYDTANSTTYCLTSPNAQQSSPAVPGPFVTLTPCPTTIPSNMKWTQVGNTGNYLTSYVIHDNENPALCLGYGLTGAPGGPSTSGNGEWDSIYVQTCDGSLEQKWNAPPNVPTGSLTGTHETDTTGG